MSLEALLQHGVDCTGQRFHGAGEFVNQACLFQRGILQLAQAGSQAFAGKRVAGGPGFCLLTPAIQLIGDQHERGDGGQDGGEGKGHDGAG